MSDSTQNSTKSQTQYAILLFIENGTWMAKHEHPEVLELFGTNTIPTPFTSLVSAEEVLAIIREKNPDRIVLLDPESHIDQLAKDNPNM